MLSDGTIGRANVLREHTATHDHRLSYVHHPSLHKQEENLLTCCRSCNQSKGSSGNHRIWQAMPYANWPSEGVQIAGLRFWHGEAMEETLL
jgi:5-methylcytosine-specific restriction endonuclease McrA